MKSLPQYWYGRNGVSSALLPISWLFSLLVFLRRWAYRLRLFRVVRLPVPVIIVGNISVGGTGKTPLVIWLVNQLKAEGYKPGIISRGYGGGARTWPQAVRPDGDPRSVGDEAILIARRTHCPMAVGPDRVAAAEALLKNSEIDVLISDDGMQHYALARDMEIVVIDGDRRFGNQRCLPAGPLREPMGRLDKVDLKVCNGVAGRGEFAMRLVPGPITHVKESTRTLSWESLAGQKLHLVAGIGNPERFFRSVQKRHPSCECHAFDDHYPFSPADLDFGDNNPVLMTEKDAMKAALFPQPHFWCLPVEASLDDVFKQRILKQLRETKHG